MLRARYAAGEQPRLPETPTRRPDSPQASRPMALRPVPSSAVSWSAVPNDSATAQRAPSFHAEGRKAGRACTLQRALPMLPWPLVRWHRVHDETLQMIDWSGATSTRMWPASMASASASPDSSANEPRSFSASSLSRLDTTRMPSRPTRLTDLGDLPVARPTGNAQPPTMLTTMHVRFLPSARGSRAHQVTADRAIVAHGVDAQQRAFDTGMEDMIVCVVVPGRTDEDAPAAASGQSSGARH